MLLNKIMPEKTINGGPTTKTSTTTPFQLKINNTDGSMIVEYFSSNILIEI